MKMIRIGKNGNNPPSPHKIKKKKKKGVKSTTIKRN